MKDKELLYFKAKSFRTQIESEHVQFYSNMNKKEKSEIYHSCNKIQFFESLYEYFMTSELTEGCLGICHGQENLIGALWDLYLKREDIRIDTWQGIEELLGAFEETLLDTGKHGAA